MHNIKKRISIILILIVLLAGAGVGGYVYLMETTKPVIRTTLSARSKEFISGRTGKDDKSWRTVNLDKKYAGEHDFDSNRVTVKNCYSVVVPFDVSDSRQNDPCIYYAILSSPRGNMTTSLRDVGFTKVTDAPDVTFRRSKKEIYKESNLTAQGTEFLVFSDITNGTDQTAFGMIGGKLFTATVSIGGSEDVKNRQLKKILESVEVQ